MITTNGYKPIMTPEERKQKVATLREEHEDYFQTIGDLNAPFIPKMAYRPPGKDDLHISFFPSELERHRDIYTEFVSIEYESEDPKRTLYLYRYNKHWREEYEIVESSSGFQRYLIPVSELKVINDIASRKQGLDIFDLNLPNPDDTPEQNTDAMVKVLSRIATVLEKIERKL